MFSDEIQKKINASINDTCNALEFDETIEFGKRHIVVALKNT